MSARRACYGLLIAALTAVALLACVAPRPTADWAQCHPNGALACTTVTGVPLGRFRVAVSLDTAPCDGCQDLAGTAMAALRVEHPPVTAIDQYDPDPFVLCRDVEAGCGGPDIGIFVFRFADDTTLPVVVVCPAIPGSVCRQVDHYGPP